jgi:DNA-binding response OmpR family regulator
VSLKVLICDTDQRFVERATRFLSGHGHQVMSEPLPSEAADLAARWRPDVVVVASEAAICDNSLLVKELHRISPRPAILLTGQLDRFHAAWQAWRSGGDELLLKPVLQAWEIHTAIIAAIGNATPTRRTVPAVPA